MTWVKYGTATNKWSVADSATTNNTPILQECMDFLETRGFTVVASVIDPTGNTTYKWVCSKNILCEDGTSQEISWAFKWRKIDGGADNYSLSLKNPNTGSEQQYHSVASNSSAGFSAWDDGLWSFWYSDQDPESYFILAGDKMIGFCPPAGSQFNSGFSSEPYYVQRGIFPLYNSNPAFQLSDTKPIDNVMAANQLTYSTPYSDIAVKMDFLWARYALGSPMFRIAGSDISALLNFSSTSNMIGTGGNTKAIVRPIGDKFYISIGYNARQGMLFDCGTTPPVLF